MRVEVADWVICQPPKEHQILVPDGFLNQVAARQRLLQRIVYNFFFDQQELARLLLYSPNASS